MKITIEVKGGHPKFYELLKEMGLLHDEKDRGYCGARKPLSNFRESKDFGIKPYIGVLLRMNDKWSRVKNHIQAVMRGEPMPVPEEKFKNDLLDFAVYSLIDIILFEEEQ